MSKFRRNQWTRGLIVAVVTLAACLGYLGLKYNREQQEARAVWSVMADFKRSRESLPKFEVGDCAALLDIIVHANANVKNRHLKLILERERSRMIGEIIDSLHKKTGDDLGSDPETWISKYSRTGSPAK